MDNVTLILIGVFKNGHLMTKWEFPENVHFLCGRHFTILDVAVFQLTHENIEIFTDDDGHKLFLYDRYIRYEKISGNPKSDKHTPRFGECDIMLIPINHWTNKEIVKFGGILKRKETIYCSGEEYPHLDLDTLFKNSPEYNNPEYDFDEQERRGFPLFSDETQYLTASFSEIMSSTFRVY